MPTTSLANLSLEQLRRAVSIREQIDGLQAELSSLLGTSSGSRISADSRVGQKRSAAARARMAEAQRARWAKAKKTGGAAPVRRRKVKFSPAALARISAAAKARWAKAKAAGKSRLG